ncbi:hypothetical protein D3C78_1009680 [compost metagenome]
MHPAIIDINGETVELVDVVAEAHELSGMTTAEWNTMPEEARHLLIDAVLDAMAGGSDDDKDGDNTDETTADQGDDKTGPDGDKAKYEAEREALALEYKAKFGAKPHYKWTMDKIREELAKPVDEGK